MRYGRLMMSKTKIISYAQNLEDILLYRALKHVKNGFYIDIGAHDPTVGSVTKLFYDLGWRGINVEPGPRFKSLCLERPLDVNINCAIGLVEKLCLYEIPSGLSTVSRMIAESHAKMGYKIEEREVTVLPLSSIFDKAEGRDVHFLKIDTEGSERQVLLSGDFYKNRPWLIVIEATYPNTQIPSYQDWHDILELSSYQLIWFDGLNRWYVASEKYGEIRDSFTCPPNFFDNYITYREYLFSEFLIAINKISCIDNLEKYKSILTLLSRESE